MTRLFYLTFMIASLFVMNVLSQLPPPPPCVEACLQTAASSFGCLPTDPNCVCPSDAIANAVASCLVDQCTLTDAQAAEGYFSDFCSGTTSPTSASLSVDTSTIESTAAPGSMLPTPSSAVPTLGSVLSNPGSASTPIANSTPLFTSSGSVHSAQQSTAAPTTNIITHSVALSTSSTPANHAKRGRIAGSFISIAFALALALVW